MENRFKKGDRVCFVKWIDQYDGQLRGRHGFIERLIGKSGYFYAVRVIGLQNGRSEDGCFYLSEDDLLPWVEMPEEIVNRKTKEIQDYMEEAFDKVWLMRSHPTDDPEIEKRRLESIERILNTYNDIPEDEYTNWECGYWNGILGALRWVLGAERDFLDT